MSDSTASKDTAHPPCVLRPDEMPRYARQGGANTIPLVMPHRGATQFVSVITTLPPGAKIPFHHHNCEESVMLLEGEALMDLADGSTHALKPMDTTWIPTGYGHRFRNPSDSKPMRILGVYGRTDATRTLTDTGETRPISAEHTPDKREN